MSTATTIQDGDDSSTEPLLPRENSRETKPKSKFRSRLILACMAAMNVLANMAYSTLAPFFPQEAAAKKLTGGSVDLEVGLIFGTFALVVFVVAPLLGVRVATIGPKFLLCAGVFLLGGATLLFGFVSSIDDWTSFLVVCFLARAVQGCGAAAVDTASWTIVATEFPDKIATVFGALETFSGLGFMIGPALGGALYKANGFPLPFFFMGGLLLLCLPGFMYALPFSMSPTADQHGPNRPTTWKVLRNIWIWMTLLTLFMSSASLGMIEATLATFLKNTFDMGPATIGLVLLLCCGVYLISAPIVGHCADRWGTKRIIIVGLFISSVGTLLLAPSFLVTSFVPRKKLWLFLLSTGIMALGLSLAAVPTFSDMIRTAQKMGFKKGMVLNGVISGISTSFFSLGEAFGPSVGGLITGKMDFSHATTIFALALAAHGYIYLILALCFPSKVK
ncbi:MFS-type transporter SLC18B1-like [Oscarella lobularis]|uniref:MFS-type transporter SLC18B1-like n=1 Tax=Oscarella lobularis TaxID=121494 RepID=UPI0033139715